MGDDDSGLNSHSVALKSIGTQPSAGIVEIKAQASWEGGWGCAQDLAKPLLRA